ncbi:MAG TPA: sigma-70 family RNA polymerase sigma factor [Caulobacteraceae bacterium]|jgi:RNA polymerase sigma-70 factor (ECF subfamily)
MIRSQRAATDGGIRVIALANPPDEARLIRRVVDGDRRAFEELYRLYHPRLTRFLSNLLRKREAVEEALNDTLMAVWRRPDSYSGASKLSTWIFAIAYRKALRARARLDEPTEDKAAETRASDEAGPEQLLGRLETQRVLLDAVSGLSADHRAVVDLTYFHEMGYKEIAEIMSCPVDTVKTRMFHARRHLKTALSGRLTDWL